MDFHLSYEWLKEFVDVRLSPEALAERLSLHSVSVERIRRMDEGIDSKVVVGRVEKIESHPNADKLRVVSVSVTSRLTTNDSRLSRVVCGGTNLREGMLVAYAPAGARVRWHGEGDPVELKPTDIRGVRSEGMICSASEIGLRGYFAEEERAILDPSFLDVAAIGKSLAVALGLDDAVLDCEITTNRPDLMSVAGLAREVSAVVGGRFRGTQSQGIKNQESRIKGSKFLTPDFRFQIHIEDRQRCPRYGAAVIENVRVDPSPWWLQRRLLAAGLRPINNVVDITNYVMCEFGQPLHAFDAAKLQASSVSTQRSAFEIVVRRARAGESIITLDGETRMLSPDVLVIADTERPIALAGIIGGRDSGVTDTTTRIVLECANFDPMVIRRGVRVLDVRTDASTRFEKGLQPEAIDAVLPRAVELLGALTGGVAGRPTIIGGQTHPMQSIAFQPSIASARIGVPIAPSAMRRTFTALGCRVAGAGSKWRVTPPWWRRGDLERSHDLVEEVARVHGYHALLSVLPTGTLPAATRPPEPPVTAFGWEDHARSFLAGCGVTEFLPSSLISRNAIEACGYATDQSVALANPLSDESAYLRPSTLATLLPAIAANHEHTPEGTVFELGNVYIPLNGELKNSRTENNRTRSRVLRSLVLRSSVQLPREESRLLIAIYGRMVGGENVMRLKGIVERLLDRLGARNVEFRRSESCAMSSGVCLWHPGRTMDVILGETLIGVLGEVHPAVVERFRIDARVAAAELDWTPILAACGARPSVADPPAFPPVKRDVAFTVDRKTAYADVVAVLGGFDSLLTHVELFDTYEDPSGAVMPMEKKSMAFHLIFSAPDRTLTAAEVDTLQVRLTKVLGERFGAEMRE